MVICFLFENDLRREPVLDDIVGQRMKDKEGRRGRWEKKMSVE